jgi:soluble lytic murein transglycosylase-like protein
MHRPPSNSTDYGSSESPSILPCRPCLTVKNRSHDLQRKAHIGELTGSFEWLCSLRSVPRVIMAVVLLLRAITVSTLIDPSPCAQTAAPSPSIEQLSKSIAEASARFAVPARWIRAVIQVESAGDAHSISPRGAMGLMQLMPGTWVELSARYGLGLDPFDARDNILAGTAYLKEMHRRFGSAGFLAAYHAGPSRYEQHLATGQPLPSETTAYVTAVTPLLTEEQGEHTISRSERTLSRRGSPVFIERANEP